MKQTSINLPKIIYRTDQPKKDGTNTFALQLHHNGKKKFISLKVYCAPEFYDVKENRIKKAHPYSKEFNLIIDTQLNKANKIILDARIKDEPITINEFLDLYLGKKSDYKNVDFLMFVQNEIDLEKKKGSKAAATVIKYGFQLNKLERYRSKIEFKDLTEGFLADFEEYMRVKLKNEKGGSNNTLKFIRKFNNVAIKKGITENYPFKNYQLKEDSSIKIKFLSIDELQRIQDYFKILMPGHKHYGALKSFLFSCYTGLRYGDGKKFRLNDINGNCIIIKTEKTNKTVSIPLLSHAKELLNYNLAPNLPNLKTPCDQTCNRALKEIAKICKINKQITTHFARHTFGCVALNNGVSKETVQAIYGHSTSKQTDQYAKLFDSTKTTEMAKLESVFNKEIEQIIKIES